MAQRVNIEVQNSNAINVEVPTAPRDFVPRFTADKTDIEEGDTVNFSASEAGFQYYWEIEGVDGFILKSAQDVSHQFIDSGDFDVALTQADLTKQKSGTQVKRDFIKVVVPDFLLDRPFALGATAAYSLRRLKNLATKAVRVREDSGNKEADIGFVAGELDETALLNHCGSANGFVTKWYDQSGNGNDASNSTASEQPQIVSSGSVIKEGNEPSIDWSSGFMVAILPQAVTLGDFSVYTSFTMIKVGERNDRIFTTTRGTTQDFRLNPRPIIQKISDPLTVATRDNRAPISINKNEKYIWKTLKNTNNVKHGYNLTSLKTVSNYTQDIDRFLISTQNPQGLGNPTPMKLNLVLAYFEDKRAEDSDITNGINDLFNVF